MGSLNKVLLIGRIGQDPEKRVTQAGQSVVTVSLATSESYKDKSGNRQTKTEWHKIIFWNQQAELIEQYCKKGSQIYVEGAIQTREWQDKDGNKRWSAEIIARQMQFLDSKQQQEGQSQGNQQSSQQQYGGDGQAGNHSVPPGGGGYVKDDIPY